MSSTSGAKGLCTSTTAFLTKWPRGVRLFCVFKVLNCTTQLMWYFHGSVMLFFPLLLALQEDSLKLRDFSFFWQLAYEIKLLWKVVCKMNGTPNSNCSVRWDSFISFEVMILTLPWGLSYITAKKIDKFAHHLDWNIANFFFCTKLFWFSTQLCSLNSSTHIN